MSIEIYKTINNFSDYEISNFGNLRNKTTKNIFKPTIKSGYYSACIKNDNNEYKTSKIHRLVALTFIPNPENKEIVYYKDHNQLNNHVSNLLWGTITELNQHKRKCKKEIQELVSSRGVWRINKDTNEKIEYYKTIKFAAQWVFDNDLTNVKEFNNGNNIKTKICAVCQKHYGRNTSFGYKWKYDTDNENKYENEEWKDIPYEIIDGIEGYKISNCGRLKNRTGKISEGYNHKSGYLWVSIAPKRYLLHRLVAKAFLLNPDNKEQVNHIDGNKSNSCVNNLEWCSHQENQIHKVNSGLSNITKKIIQYDLQMNKIKEFNSQMDASRELNICDTSISKCCLRKQKTSGGFIFKFNE